MLKSLFVSALLACSLFAGCTDSEDETGTIGGKTPTEESVAERYCKRGDECNLLYGSSIAECTSDVEAILDDATPSDRKEIEFDLEKCLERPTCGGFADCLGL